MSKLKLGIIGSNFVSDWLCEATRLTEDFELRAVFSRTAEKGNAFAEKHSIGKVYTDFEQFLSSDIDAVYIASPNFAHAAQAVAAAEHGKHVLCEKPVSSNLAEYRAMRRAAHEHKVVLLEAMRPAFDPALEAVKRLLPKIGRIRRASFEFCQYSSRYDKYREGEILQAFKSEFSNAAVMDIGVYPIHFCLRLFGRPTGEVWSKSVILENGFEGSGEILLPYEGMTAVISYAKTFDSATPSIISGEDGSILIDKMSAPRKITLVPRKGEAEDIPFDFRENNMVFELSEFARLIRTGSFVNEHEEFSEMELRLLDTVRKQNGIVFPADSPTV